MKKIIFLLVLLIPALSLKLSASNLPLSRSTATAEPRYPDLQGKPASPSALNGARIRIKKHINALAGPGTKGRGPGETGLDQAAVYIANQFLELELRPFESKNLMHNFEGKIDGKTYRLRNVLGKINGSDPRLAGEYVFVSAHYDHLPARNGAVYPGANDNASGVALLLELAGYFSKHRPQRSLVFAAFSGEEEGRLGSRELAARLLPARLAAINAAVNLDTVGSMNGNKLVVVNAESSDAWPALLRAVSLASGVTTEIAMRDLDSSDQVSFIEKGIPAVQLFTPPGTDYHQPSDTADKLNIEGIIRAGEFARELVNRLAGKDAFLPRRAVPAAPEEKPGGTDTPARRTARAGFSPDFTWQGKGVRIGEVSADGPLAKLGVRAGDVLVRMDGAEITGLRQYAQELKKRKPGDVVELTLTNGGIERALKITLEEQEKK